MTMGRPRKYKTKAKLKKKIDDYFKSISITHKRTEKVITGYHDVEKERPIYKDVPVLNNLGEQLTYIEYVEKPSILRMCLYLGIDRDTLRYAENNPISNSEGKVIQDFSATIKVARDEIEAFKADLLQRSQGQVTGIIFDLKNNHGWTDKLEIDSHNVNENHEMTVEKALELLKSAGIDPESL